MAQPSLSADEFLKGYIPVATKVSIWREGKIELAISAYIVKDAPPAELVSSVRAIVFRGDDVLVMRNRDGTHILPGGRIEQGESQMDALRREILEEAGIEITDIRRIGFMYLQHRTPKPPGYPYPYPDFFWPIFSAQYLEDSPNGPVPDEYEQSSEFVPASRLKCLELSQSELAFLQSITDGENEKDG
jgi:8-oxo-dGTP pyrophosphatase MutT (NUDIX family)